MAKSIMIQGTMSNVGKSVLVAGLCRVFRQDGYSVAPFKSQNMAMNSYITPDGFEMGRAQSMQAEAAGIVPQVEMNPILLKPSGHMRSQVILRGKLLSEPVARAYYENKKTLLPHILKAYDTLAQEHEIIVIEGAGSPVELNLIKDDVANMGIAKALQSPVLLVGDIDRGGIFATLYGTLELFDPDSRELVKGTIVNKFMGDVELFRQGMGLLEDLTKLPLLGVVPGFSIDLEDEDSLSPRMSYEGGSGGLDIAIIRLPQMSNFTDFSPLYSSPQVSLRYVSTLGQLGKPHMIFLPNSEDLVADLEWLAQSGLQGALREYAKEGGYLGGIGGGYHLLGQEIIGADKLPRAGAGLLPIKTEVSQGEMAIHFAGKIGSLSDPWRPLSGVSVAGTIHPTAKVFPQKNNKNLIYGEGFCEGSLSGMVWGTDFRDIFQQSDFLQRLLETVAAKAGIPLVEAVVDYHSYKQAQYDKLADVIRESLDMEAIYGIIFGS